VRYKGNQRAKFCWNPNETVFIILSTEIDWLSSLQRLQQHSIGYLGDSFYRDWNINNWTNQYNIPSIARWHTAVEYPRKQTLVRQFNNPTIMILFHTMSGILWYTEIKLTPQNDAEWAREIATSAKKYCTWWYFRWQKVISVLAPAEYNQLCQTKFVKQRSHGSPLNFHAHGHLLAIWDISSFCRKDEHRNDKVL